MNLKKGIIRVFSANLLQVISAILVGFFVPSILSINDYSYLKTYTFYIGYIGLLHLGFVDGMYIRYGGRKIEELDTETIVSEHL